MAALLMVITILSAITRIVTRLVTVGNLKLDDALVAASTVSFYSKLPNQKLYFC